MHLYLFRKKTISCRFSKEFVHFPSKSGGSFSISIRTPRTVPQNPGHGTSRREWRSAKSKAKVSLPGARLVWTTDSESAGRLVLCHLPAMQMPFSAGSFIGSPEWASLQNRMLQVAGRSTGCRLSSFRYVTDSTQTIPPGAQSPQTGFMVRHCRVGSVATGFNRGAGNAPHEIRSGHAGPSWQRHKGILYLSHKKNPPPFSL
jgi:hypothetical protein